MGNPLQEALNQLSATFVASIVEVIRASSLADVARDSTPHSQSAAPPRAHEAPRGRQAESRASATPGARALPRSAEKDAATIVLYLRSHPGTTGEAARRALGLQKNRWNTCVYRGLREGKIRKVGDRRLTKYWAV